MEKIVRCEKCGAMVKVLIDCTCDDCGIKCCNETMKEISEEDAKKYISNSTPCGSGKKYKNCCGRNQ